MPFIVDAYVRAGAFRWMRTWIAGKRHDAFAAAAGILAPTLVLVGERDPVVSVHFATAIAGTIGSARVRIIPNAAHAVIYDEAERFNAAVLEFLEEVRASREEGVAIPASPYPLT